MVMHLIIQKKSFINNLNHFLIIKKKPLVAK